MSTPHPPHIIATRDGYRLVHQVRNESSWPNISDLTLEEERTDAMGEKHWVFINSWCLGEHTPPLREQDFAHVALKMLLDPGKVVKAR